MASNLVQMVPLCGLIDAGAIPLHYAILLFDSKVDSILDFGRWLTALSPGAAVLLDEAQANWARSLLGAEHWRNGGVCCSELGWGVSGAARGVRSVALRRARILSRSESDWYRQFFVYCADRQLGWSRASRLLLEAWSLYRISRSIL